MRGVFFFGIIKCEFLIRRLFREQSMGKLTLS